MKGVRALEAIGSDKRRQMRNPYKSLHILRWRDLLCYHWSSQGQEGQVGRQKRRLAADHGAVSSPNLSPSSRSGPVYAEIVSTREQVLIESLDTARLRPFEAEYRCVTWVE